MGHGHNKEFCKEGKTRQIIFPPRTEPGRSVIPEASTLHGGKKVANVYGKWCFMLSVTKTISRQGSQPYKEMPHGKK